MLFILPLLPGEAAPKAAERYFDKEIVRMDKAKRKAIIAGNWKMNKTATEAAKLVDELIPAVKDASCEVVICTPYTDLVTAVEKTKGTNIHVALRMSTLRSPVRSPARSAPICWWIWVWSTSSSATPSAASTLQRPTRP